MTSDHKRTKIDAVRNFCDERSAYGRVNAVRDPNDRRGLKNAFIEEVLSQAIDDYLDFTGQETVLDLGCGTGIFTEKLAHKVRHIIGLDISSEMLSLAVRSSNSSVPVYCQYDGVSMPLPTNQFDYVFTRELFHLLPDDIVVEMLGECHRILRPNGLMLSIEFASNNPRRQRGIIGRYERPPSAAISLFESLGFRCREYYPVRRGRSLRQYLIRYGFYGENENVISALAGKERSLLRNKTVFNTRYNAQYMYVFENVKT